MEQSETSHGDRAIATNDFNSSESDKAEKKKSFWKRARNLFRYISLAEYRTPMYFANRDSYKSATSGFMSIVSALALAILFYNIFVPIIRMEEY